MDLAKTIFSLFLLFFSISLLADAADQLKAEHQLQLNTINKHYDAKNKVTAAQRAAPAEAVQLEEPGARVRLSAALRLHRRAAEQGSFLSQRKIADCAAGIPPFVLEYASPATVASLDADAQEPTWEDDVRGRSGGRKGDQAAAGASGEVESEMQGGSASATASSRFGVGTAPLCRRNLTLASEWYWRAVNLVRAPCCLPRAKNVAHLSHPQLRYGTSPSSPAINLPAARGTCTCAGRRRSKAQAWLATAYGRGRQRDRCSARPLAGTS